MKGPMEYLEGLAAMHGRVLKEEEEEGTMESDGADYGRSERCVFCSFGFILV